MSWWRRWQKRIVLRQRAGRERLALKGRAFSRLKKGDVVYESSSCAASKDKISVQFSRTGITVVMKANPRKHYLVFEVESISDPNIDQIFLLNLPVTSGQFVSDISGARPPMPNLPQQYGP